MLGSPAQRKVLREGSIGLAGSSETRMREGARPEGHEAAVLRPREP